MKLKKDINKLYLTRNIASGIQRLIKFYDSEIAIIPDTLIIDTTENSVTFLDYSDIDLNFDEFMSCLKDRDIKVSREEAGIAFYSSLKKLKATSIIPSHLILLKMSDRSIIETYKDN